MVKDPPANPGDTGLIPRLRCLGGRNGNPLQYSWLESPMDRGEPGGLQKSRMGSKKSQIWLGTHTMHNKLLHIGQINNKVLLHSTGNYSQYPVIHHNGREYWKECIYVYNWFTLLYRKDWHNIVNQLQVNKNKFRKRLNNKKEVNVMFWSIKTLNVNAMSLSVYSYLEKGEDFWMSRFSLHMEKLKTINVMLLKTVLLFA